MDDKLLKEFIKFAQEKYGCTIILKESKEPDTFKKIFGFSALDSLGDLFHDEAIKIEYPNVRNSAKLAVEERSIYNPLKENTQFFAA